MKRGRGSVSRSGDLLRRKSVLVSLVILVFAVVYFVGSNDNSYLSRQSVSEKSVGNSMSGSSGNNVADITGQSVADDGTGGIYEPLYFSFMGFSYTKDEVESNIGPNFRRDFMERYAAYEIDMSAITPAEEDAIIRELTATILRGEEPEFVCFDNTENGGTKLCYMNFIEG